MICRQARMFIAMGASLTLLISMPGIADAQPSKADQKCINTVNKNAAKIVKAQGKVICDCIKDAAKGNVEAQLIGTIEKCLTLDRFLKVKKAKNKLDDKIAKDCASYPEDPNGFAPVDLSDPNFIKARSMEKDLSLIHWIFGNDLDAVIVKEGDPNTPNAKNVSKCQQAVAKQAKKCQDTKLKVFLACKKDGMKGKTTPGQISSSEDLEGLCLQSDPNDPTTPQPDPKGKIAKACDSKLASTIQKKCTDKGVDLSVAFPLFDPNGGTLKDYVEVMVECEVCLYWNDIDGLDRNCDLFDDGMANGSCSFGEFLALSYNVAGLPDSLSGSIPSLYTPIISPLLNGYDLVLVQESWQTPDPNPLEPLRVYHELLVADADHPYKSEPAPLPLGTDPNRPEALVSDGLNRFSQFPFDPVVREAWSSCFGLFDHGADCLALKGFSVARTTLAAGVTLDIYNLHMEAGNDPNDVLVRDEGVTLLSDFLNVFSAGEAVIVGGDFNLHSDEEPDSTQFQRLLSETGLTDVCDFLGCPEPGRIDKFLFRSNDSLTLTPRSWNFETDVFVTDDEQPLSDHEALAVRFDWSPTPASE